MRLIRHPEASALPSTGVVAALSDLDGFHLGHERLVARAVERARGRALSAAAVVLCGRSLEADRRLTTLRQKVRLLDTGAIDWVVVSPWLAGSERYAEALADRLTSLRTRAVVVTQETAAAGGCEDPTAERVAQRLGIEIEVVPTASVGGKEVSSDAVRRALQDGDLSLVERMLGRPYAVCGRVVHGHHRGKGLGIPTANLMPRGIALPPDGVYAVRANVAGRELAGVANVGRKPTFGDLERTVEVHLLDFDEEIYGRRLEVAFAARLRGELRFPSVDALVEQIHADIARARLLLAG